MHVPSLNNGLRSAAADRGRYGNARSNILKAIFVALHKAQVNYTLPRVGEASHSGGGRNRQAWESSQMQDASGTGPSAQTMLAAQQVHSWVHAHSNARAHVLMKHFA